MDLEQVIKQSQGERYVYPDIFLDNCGLDIVLPNDKLHAVRSWGYRKNNPRRRATLEVSTFRGISFNAIARLIPFLMTVSLVKPESFIPSV